MTLAKRVEREVSQIRDLVARLESTFSTNSKDAAILLAAKERALLLREAAIGLGNKLEKAIETPGCAADMTPTDKRKVWDKRRQYVVETCCYLWIDVGKVPTYTVTHYEGTTATRTGELIDFIQSVVEKVTDPPSRLPVDTVCKDIDRFRVKLRRPDPMTLPPEKG